MNDKTKVLAEKLSIKKKNKTTLCLVLDKSLKNRIERALSSLRKRHPKAKWTQNALIIAGIEEILDGAGE